MTDQITVDDIAALDESEVFVRLGTALLGAASAGPDHARAFGERWFSWKLPEIRMRLCGEDTLQGLGPEPGAAAVAELLTKLGDRTTVACAAVLVVRRGLEAVCEDDDDD